MNISVETDRTLLDTEVLIRCVEVDEHIESMVAALSIHERKIATIHDDGTKMISAHDMLYIESVDRHVFAYTSSSVHEVPFKLYELEDRLRASGFERISKNCIVNLCRVDRLVPYVGSRLLATLDNEEKIVISRSYAGSVRSRLGIGKGADHAHQR